MGKKKRQKTKELSVAIAEASSKAGDTEQQEETQQPRKRGRPRKVAVETVGKEKKSEAIEEPTLSTAAQGSLTKKEEEQEQGACTIITKDKGGVEFADIQIPKEEPSRSKARRKSKPRKST